MEIRNKKRIGDPRQITQFLLQAIEGDSTVDVEIQPAGFRTHGFFVCQDGNVGKRDALLVTTLDTEEEKQAYSSAKTVTMHLQSTSRQITVQTQFVDFVTVNGASCVRLAFPRDLSVVAISREFKRLKVPYTVDLFTTLQIKNTTPFQASIIDLTIGGCSMLRKVDAKGQTHPPMTIGNLFKMTLHSPVKSYSGDISLSGVARKILRVRNRYNEVQEITNVEFILISSTERSAFDNLLRALIKEEKRAKQNVNPILDRCTFETEVLGEGHSEVQVAIESGKPEAILAMLTVWSLDDTVRRALIMGLIKIIQAQSGTNSFLVTAMKSIQETAGWTDDCERLVEAIVEKKHVLSAIETLEVVPLECNQLDALALVIVTGTSPEQLLRAMRASSDKPRIQKRLLPALIQTGSIRFLAEAFQYVDKDSPVFTNLVDAILEKGKFSSDFLPLILGMTDVESPVYAKLVKRFLKVAPIKELAHLLSKQISDDTQLGEFLASEIVNRGQPENMAEAFKHTTMDSFASVILAYGLASFSGSKTELIDQALTQTAMLPRAEMILKHAQLLNEVRVASKKSTLSRLLNLDGATGKKELAVLEEKVRALSIEAEQEIRQMSKIIHGFQTGRLREK